MMLNLYLQKNVFISMRFLLVFIFVLVNFSGQVVFAQNSSDPFEKISPFEFYGQSQAIKDLKKKSDSLHSDELIKQWTANAVQKSLTMNTLGNYNFHLYSVSSLFTKAGFDSYKEILESERLGGFVSYNNLHLNAVLLQPPKIVGKGVVQGERYGWTLSVPIEIQYIQDLRFQGEESANSAKTAPSQTTTWNLILVVVRDNDVNNPVGIGFQRWARE